MFSNILFFLENRAVDDLMWKNTTQPDRPQIQYGACALTLDTQDYKDNTFPLQQWLHERSSVLRYTRTARLVMPDFTPPPRSK